MIAAGMRVLLHHGGSYYSTGIVRDVDGRVCLVEDCGRAGAPGRRRWASVLQVTPLPAELPAEPAVVDPWVVYVCAAVVVAVWVVIGGLVWVQ